MGSLLSFSGLCGATALCHEYVCAYVCASMHLVCLIGIVSISKRPDSHPASLCETKAGQLMMQWMSLDQLSMLMFVSAETEKHTASVRDTVNVFALEVLQYVWHLHGHMVIKLMVTLKND